METLFDVATEAELVDLLGEPLKGESVPYETEREIAEKGTDTGFVWLAELYAFRNDTEQANKCLTAIKDPQARLDTMRLINHPNFAS